MNNHIKTDIKELCTGCGVCKAVCSVNAIKFNFDDEGFLSPEVDEKLCLNCGKCLKACHLQSEGTSDKRKPLGQYAVKVKNENVRIRSRSGGAFVALSNFILKQGGIVYGAVLNSSLKTVHFRAETAEDRNKMCGSKYVQSNTLEIWEQLKEDVLSGRLVLFTGTPCQVEAANQYIGKNYENLYLCDFVCHGVPSPKLFESYLSFMQNKFGGKIIGFDFRDKREHTWASHVEKTVFEENRIIYSRRYTNIFYSNNCLRRSCYKCRYTSPDRASDFTIADYWGIDKTAPEFDDGKGISALLIRGEKAKMVLNSVMNEIEIVDTSKYPLPHYNLKRPTAMPETHDKFFEDMKKHGFGFVSSKYGGYDFLRKLRYKIKDKIN